MGLFGFSYVGLVFLLALFIPNLFWTKNKPKDYDPSGENRVLLAFERVGQAWVTCAALAFFEGWQCLPEGIGGIAHTGSLEEERPSGKPAASASGPGPKRRGRRAAGFSGGECQRTIPRWCWGCSRTRQ